MGRPNSSICILQMEEFGVATVDLNKAVLLHRAGQGWGQKWVGLDMGGAGLEWGQKWVGLE